MKSEKHDGTLAMAHRFSEGSCMLSYEALARFLALAKVRLWAQERL